MSVLNIKSKSTQEHLDIEDIKDNMVVLKNSKVCAILKTTAVNFDLFSEMEQDAIIAAFSMFLNSLTFPVQVVVRSKKVDLTKYLDSLIRVEKKQSDPLLKYQATQYKKFIQEIIEKNEVLDKSFYVIVPSGKGSNVQMGSNPFDWIFVLMGKHTKRITFDVDKVLRTAKLDLVPKVEQIISEFGRLRIIARQLTTQELVELFFDLYNPTTTHGQRIRSNINDYLTAVVSPAVIEE